MQKDFDAGGVKITLELPDDYPEGVPIDIDIDFEPEDEEGTRAVIAAFGGVESFESFSFGSAYLKGAGILAHPKVRISIPEKTRPKPPSPFLTELEQERRDATAEKV